MDPAYEQFSRFALTAAEKREKFSRLAGELFLELDLDGGIAKFGGRLSVPFQVLGTESDNTLSWLWAWADEQAEMPEGLLRAARAMKLWLEANGLGALAAPSLDLDHVDGLYLSLIATEVCRADACYRDIYEGGALCLLLFGTGVPRMPDLDRAGIVGCLADLASRYEFDHRRSLEEYARAKGLPCSADGASINIQLASGERIVAGFDERGRTSTMNGEPFMQGA